ncbi:hypothetical protein JR316_0012176 [Psilocybe cubensis]|uniref:Uncharacterized protein n=2 Tax=Psilocybe cubensis TaxID=181762 RepID=A0ACB8GHD9_PSICU|nr:hypothetical protein JR316_0012176 [Psilocybe cubensis]KAH9475071.1 hypothetical protein JR316_0012176 [Psilocybe cubensis]
MSSNIQSEARYVIVNKKSGTVIDLSGTDNYQVIGWERHNGTNQQWETIEVGGGWHIKNVGNGKYLSLGGASAQDGVSVVGTDDHFLWELKTDDKDPNGVRIKVPHSYQNVDLSDHGNPTPGTHVVVWGRWEGTNQVWYFEQGIKPPLNYEASVLTSLCVQFDFEGPIVSKENPMFPMKLER